MKSNVWRHFIPLTLTQNMRIKRLLQSNLTPDRTQELKDHEKWLLQVGRGTLPTVQIKGASNIIEVSPNMVCYSPKILKEKVYFSNIITTTASIYAAGQYSRTQMKWFKSLMQKC
jgi:hypothetical protein